MILEKYGKFIDNKPIFKPLGVLDLYKCVVAMLMILLFNFVPILFNILAIFGIMNTALKIHNQMNRCCENIMNLGCVALYDTIQLPFSLNITGTHTFIFSFILDVGISREVEVKILIMLA